MCYHYYYCFGLTTAAAATCYRTAATLLKRANENADIINMDFCELNLDVSMALGLLFWCYAQDSVCTLDSEK